jgi:hypothetical protein
MLGSIHIMPKLEVPLVLPLQEDGYSCVPRCVKMVFMYISNCLDGQAPNMDVDDIAEIIETRKDGTLIEDIRNLNKNKKVIQVIPSLEFDVNLNPHSLSEIEDEIKNHRPLIAWVELSDGNRKFSHAVVIIGFEKDDKHLIFYNDPIFGEQQEEIGTFMARWERADRLLVKVKIGKREQRLLEEYIQKEKKGNKVVNL